MPRILTLEDLELQGKTVFVRADLNTPVDPKDLTLLETTRIDEASLTMRDLSESKVVVGSHQGRVGRYDYISLEQHSRVLSQVLGKAVIFADDVFGAGARKMISSLSNGEVLVLDNLRFSAEENMEFTPEEASKTVLVQRLSKLLDACVLDAFPTAHRAHPSIVGFSHHLPTAAGRLVYKELKSLTRLFAVDKGPYTTVLGGAKISDRLEAIDTLIENKRADKVLLTGLVANVFLKAAKIIDHPLRINEEEYLVSKTAQLLEKYPGTFELPIDVAVSVDGERKEVSVKELKEGDKVYDIGSKTIDHYSRIMRSSGTVFMSGPPGVFEMDGFGVGTEALMRALASSFGTTIVSGGHLTAALEKYRIRDWIDHISTAGGALVMYLAGKKLPLIEALERAAERWSDDKSRS